MWTSGKDKEQPGKFAYELWDGFELVQRVGGFDTPGEADRAAEDAQRRFLFPPATDEFSHLTNEELLAELLDDGGDDEGKI